jgi:hypothetical protein
VTLILAYTSNEYVALASDRRVSTQRRGVTESWEDAANKAIVVHGRGLIGYTGFARLGGMETDRWVVEKLSGVEPPELIDVLTRETEVAVKTIARTARLPQHLTGHAFVFVAYSATSRDLSAPMGAYSVTISNALGDGQWEKYGTWQPIARFCALRTEPVEPGKFHLSAFGFVPSREEIRELRRHVHEYRLANPGKMLGIVDLMIRAIRRTADNHDEVGKAVSVSVLPRVALPRGPVVSIPLSGDAIRDPVTELTCFYVPEAAGITDAVSYPPAILGQGWMMQGAQVWTTKPPWWRH